MMAIILKLISEHILFFFGMLHEKTSYTSKVDFGDIFVEDKIRYLIAQFSKFHEILLNRWRKFAMAVQLGCMNYDIYTFLSFAGKNWNANIAAWCEWEFMGL